MSDDHACIDREALLDPSMNMPWKSVLAACRGHLSTNRRNSGWKTPRNWMRAISNYWGTKRRGHRHCGIFALSECFFVYSNKAKSRWSSVLLPMTSGNTFDTILMERGQWSHLSEKFFVQRKSSRAIDKLEGKVIIMRLLENPDSNVRYQGLLCVQKLMVHNW